MVVHWYAESYGFFMAVFFLMQMSECEAPAAFQEGQLASGLEPFRSRGFWRERTRYLVLHSVVSLISFSKSDLESVILDRIIE